MSEEEETAESRPSDEDAHKIMRVFKAFDLDCDGVIDATELGKVLKGLDPNTWDDDKLNEFMTVADMNGDGLLQYEEFLNWVMGQSEMAQEAVISGESFAETCPEGFTPCKWGAKCFNRNPGHRTKFWHPELLNDRTKPDARRACRYGAGCYQKNIAHLESFAHPGDRNYRLGLVLFGRRKEPDFQSLWQLFNYYDPDESGHISKEEFELSLADLGRYSAEVGDSDEAWEAAGGNDHGYVNFAHFSEWASSAGADLPIGLDAVGSNRPCRFSMASKGGWRCSCANFEPSNNPAVCVCGHKASAHRADEIGDPWDFVTAEGMNWEAGKTGLVEVVDDPDLTEQIQTLLDETHKEKDNWTRDRGCKIHGRSHPECSFQCIRRNGHRVPTGYEVVKIYRNQNPDLWRAFCMSRASIKNECESEGRVPYEDVDVLSKCDLDNALHSGCNEWRLFHGTALGACKGICDTNFRLSLSGTGATWKDPGADKGSPLYGYGIYLAERITKADEYAGDCEGDDEGLNCALICRCVGGRANVCETNEINKTQLRQDVFDGPYHCVYGDRVKTLGKPYREIVVYDKDQIFPEFMVCYSRRF